MARALTHPHEENLNVEFIYDRHRDYLWFSLYRLGVASADLPDVLQEVLIVVHRRLSSFDRASRLTTWLFGICLRVAAGYRRRSHRRHEQLSADGSHAEPTQANPGETVTSALDARQRLTLVLDQLPLDQRAVFAMFEVEGLCCAEIADQMGIPLGTVHSRLYAARNGFKEALTRLEARERHSLRSPRGAT